MSESGLDPNVEFGRTEGLLVYTWARSIDSDSSRPDHVIPILAEDAVRVAVRLRAEEDPIGASRIDIDLATIGLIGMLTDGIPPID